MPEPSGPITDLLREWRAGSPGALDRLTPIVYAELQKLARRYMRSERPGHTLQPTAVVHEAYVRLVDVDVAWEGRVHFFAVAARLLRRILVDHAKARRRVKRGGAAARVTLDEALVVSPEPSPDLVVLDEVLSALAAQDPRKAQIVELHFFGGLTYDELAAAVGVSTATVHRELRLAKAWLQREMAHR